MKRALTFGIILALAIAAPAAAKPKKGPHALAAETFISVDTPVVQVGGTLTVSASGDGVVTCYGSIPETGEIVWAYPFVGYHTSYTYSPVGYSQNWAANPVPLNGECVLYQQDLGNGLPNVAATAPFSLLP